MYYFESLNRTQFLDYSPLLLTGGYVGQQLRSDQDRLSRTAEKEKAGKVRVLLAKPGGVDRELRMAALSFIIAGFEVIYIECCQKPEQILSAAIQEDVDLIGLHLLPGDNGCSFHWLVELLEQTSAENISVIGLGIFLPEDVHKLKNIGIREIFAPCTKPKHYIDWVNNNIRPVKRDVLERKGAYAQTIRNLDGRMPAALPKFSEFDAQHRAI